MAKTAAQKAYDKRRSETRKNAGVTADGRKKATYATENNAGVVDKETHLQTMFAIENAANYGPAAEEAICPSVHPVATETEVPFWEEDVDPWDFDAPDAELAAIEAGES